MNQRGIEPNFTDWRDKKKSPTNKFWNLSICNKLYQTMVRERGLEPPRLTALAPKASVSTIPPLAHVCWTCRIIPDLKPQGQQIGRLEVAG